MSLTLTQLISFMRHVWEGFGSGYQRIVCWLKTACHLGMGACLWLLMLDVDVYINICFLLVG